MINVERTLHWLDSIGVKIGPVETPDKLAEYLEIMARQIREDSDGEFNETALHHVMAVALAVLSTLDANVDW